MLGIMLTTVTVIIIVEYKRKKKKKLENKGKDEMKRLRNPPRALLSIFAYCASLILSLFTA
ncbi:hypothetical protein WN48_09849 [Eufriesea mexicana]|nr:hypothetical protein WN48_09849 [Eufriesea mexicana]